MKTKILLLFTLWLSLFLGKAHAQLENIVLELYYVSDSIDATDTIGGGLAAGSIVSI